MDIPAGILGARDLKCYLLPSGGDLRVEMQDADLLAEFAANGSETAFVELTKRYVDFVYNTARRQVRDPHQAAEVTQMVFCLLARKAASLRRVRALAGWLHRATCFTAAKAIRADQRRKRREEEAVRMTIEPNSQAGEVWEHLAPLLDQALEQLNEKDRVAVLVRYFQGKPMREVGEALGVSEAAAKMRVGRAVERLRRSLGNRGIACSAAAFELSLSKQSLEGAPPGLMPSISALIDSGSAATSTIALSNLELLVLMANAKLKIAIPCVLAGVILLTGGLCSYLQLSAETSEHVATTTKEDRDLKQGSSQRLSPAERLPAFERPGLGTGLSDASNLTEAAARLWTVLRLPGTNGMRIRAEEIADALRRFDGHEAVAFEILKNALSDSELHVQEGAVYGLGKIAKEFPDAVPFLWSILESLPSIDPDRNPSQRFVPSDAAYYALKEAGFQPTDVPRLMELLRTDLGRETLLWIDIPKSIAAMLENNPWTTGPAVQSLNAFLESNDPNLRLGAALALAKHAGNSDPRVFREISQLYAMSNDRLTEYRKYLASGILEEMGSNARSFIPSLIEFAQSSGHLGFQDQAFRALAAIAPDLRSVIPDVQQILAEREQSRAWEEKWRSGAYTYMDLQSALKVPGQAIESVKRLAELGPNAEAEVPAILRALWGRDEAERGLILESLLRIDPRASVARVERYPIETGFQYAEEHLNQRPVTAENRLLRSYLDEQPRSWYCYDEVVEFAERLATVDRDLSHAFVRGILSEAPELKLPMPK